MTELTISWNERNQRELMSFVAGDTGGKLVAHYRNTMQRLLNEAMNEVDPDLAITKLATAKGFSIALAIIDLPVERQNTPQTEEYAEDEHKTNATFAKIISRPATFK